MGSYLLPVLFLLPSLSEAGTESDFVYVEQFSENRYLVEVREVGVDGWPILKQSLTLNSHVTSEKKALKEFLQRSTQAPLQPSQSARTLTPSTPVPLWQVTNAWSEQWEKKYSEWVTREIDVEFFERHQIPTDCADIVYAARWIFSRLHSLPAAFLLAGTNTLLTHQSVRADWAQLPADSLWNKDQKFLASLNYLLDHTNTESLRTAGYPIAINANSLTAGSYRVRTNSNGRSRHTYLYNAFNAPPSDEYPISNLQSTLPREVRKLYAGTFDPSESYSDPGEGLQRLRWAVKVGSTFQILAPNKHPSFSQEQFDPQIIPPKQWAMKILQTVNPNFDESWMSKVAGDTMIQNILTRARVVEEGFAFCQKSDCSPESPAYEAWSTPVRDSRAIDYYRSYARYVSSQKLAQTVVILGQPYPVSFIYQSWEVLGPGSNDPRDSIENRWGFFPQKMKERIQDLLQVESEKRRILLQTKNVDSSERYALDSGIQNKIRRWTSPYIYESHTNISIRTLLSEILKSLSTQHLVINGSQRSLRNWLAFFSAASAEPLGEDPWGESLGSDWRVGAFGEKVFAADTQNNMTLTEYFLIDETSLNFIEIDGVTGPIQRVNGAKHVIAIRNTIFNWDSKSKFVCTKKNDHFNIFAVYNSELIVCGDQILRNTPSGFQIFKTGLNSVDKMPSDGFRNLAVGIIHSDWNSDSGSFISEDGTSIEIEGLSGLHAYFRTRNHLILQRGANWTSVSLKTRSATEFSAAFPQHLTLNLIAHLFSDTVLVQDSEGKLWALDLENAPLTPRLLHSGPVSGASRLETSDFIQVRPVGYTFRIESEGNTPRTSFPYFSFVWGQHETFSFSHGGGEIPRVLVASSNGFRLCGTQATFRLDSHGLSVTDPNRCRIDLRKSAISKESTDSDYWRRSIATNARLSNLLPEMDPVESWNEDYLPIKRTLDFAEGVIWIRNN